MQISLWRLKTFVKLGFRDASRKEVTLALFVDGGVLLVGGVDHGLGLVLYREEAITGKE
jgi:hypothetical protein